MKEGGPGTSWRAREEGLPEDARVYRRLNSWTLYIYDREHSLIIDTTDYHPGPLYLTRDDLEAILKRLA